jgi:signal transduction histidine kinase
MHSFLGVPLKMKGHAIGALYLADKEGEGGFTEDDQELVSLLASQAAVAIENARLYQEAMAVAAMEERERIAHDLHDNIIQSLYAVGLSLERAARRLEREPEEARRRIGQAIEEINGIMRDIRNYIFGLGTADVEGTDLNAALQQVLREFEVNSLAAARLDMDPNLPELSVQARAHLLQFVREALSNVLKHASAGQVRVSILREGAEMVASVSDDGKGFDPDQAGPSKGYGLRNMAERAKAFGGSFHLSSHPGLGTTVTLRLPLDSVTGLR